MTVVINPWRDRSLRLVRGIHWVAWLVGAGLNLTIAIVDASSQIGQSVTAALLTLGYVVALTAIPRRLLARPVVRELTALLGVALTMSAVGLTGGLDSPYLLLSLCPALFAAIAAGIRLAVSTALLAFLGLVAITWLGTDLTEVWRDLAIWFGLYLLVAIAFSYARLLLIDQQRQTEAFARASQEIGARVQRLDETNRLLTELAQVSDPGELSPMTMAAAALDSLGAAIPMQAAVVVLEGDDGPVVVARRGTDEDDLQDETLTLRAGDRVVGRVRVATSERLSPDQHEVAEELLRPLALGFSNVLLLQDITRTAIREERVRLARDLHDEIGPSLASLGLALDVALVQGVGDPALNSNLERLRTDVGGLVEEVRATVSDLRTIPTTSLTQTVLRAAARSAGEHEVVVELNENRPPRPAIAGEVAAIVTEAVRNALRHSGGGTIRVGGVVDFDRGRVEVVDDGHGFDPEAVPDGHFGLQGMRERATRIGARLEVDAAGGTTVRLTWGTAP